MTSNHCRISCWSIPELDSYFVSTRNTWQTCLHRAIMWIIITIWIKLEIRCVCALEPPPSLFHQAGSVSDPKLSCCCPEVLVAVVSTVSSFSMTRVSSPFLWHGKAFKSPVKCIRPIGASGLATLWVEQPLNKKERWRGELVSWMKAVTWTWLNRNRRAFYIRRLSFSLDQTSCCVKSERSSSLCLLFS